jgi:hypothetical protein
VSHDRDEHDHDEAGDDDSFASALVLTPRQAFVDWALAQEHGRGDGETEARQTLVVLTPELPGDGDRAEWLGQHHLELFARQLAPWTEDESRWPADRSVDTLESWFELTWAPYVDDMSESEIMPAVTCGPVSLPALLAEYTSLALGSALFLDVQNGDMVSFSPEELGVLDHADASGAGLPEREFADLVQLFESPSLVALPSPSEEADLALMETFAESIRVPATRNRLMAALDSKKPTRRFLETVDTSGLRSRWLGYRDGAIMSALRETLEHFHVPFNEPDGARD